MNEDDFTPIKIRPYLWRKCFICKKEVKRASGNKFSCHECKLQRNRNTYYRNKGIKPPTRRIKPLKPVQPLIQIPAPNSTEAQITPIGNELKANEEIVKPLKHRSKLGRVFDKMHTNFQ